MTVSDRTSKITAAIWGPLDKSIITGHEAGEICQWDLLKDGQCAKRNKSHEGLVNDIGVTLDPRGNVEANEADYQTSVDKVFACGDTRRGQSLVVWAIREGRQAARSVDQFLMGHSELPR